jgi:hypothetical protein
MPTPSTRRTARPTGPRKARTTDFAPYYKVQVRDPRSLTWTPTRGMYATEEEAWAAAPDGARLMHMTPTAKTPITR